MRSRLLAWLRERPTPAFFLLTFGFAWGIWIPVGLLAPEQLRLATLPGAWSPTLAAVVLTVAREGRPGLRSLWRRLWRLRQHPVWYLVSIFGIGLLAGVTLLVHRLLGGSTPEPTLPEGIPPEAWPVAVPLLFLSNLAVGGPFAEEPGWRGYALPLMRDSIGALRASLVIGLAWGLWHLPFFVIPGAESVVGGVALPWFLLLTVASSVLFSWVYLETGSIFIAVLGHASVNTTLGTLGVLGPESGGTLVALNVALTWLAAGFVILLWGPELSSSRAARDRQRQFVSPGRQPVTGSDSP